MTTPCPICEGQGNIYQAKVLDLKTTISICNECEACWTNDQTTNIKNFKGLTSFLKERKLSYETTKIENLEYSGLNWTANFTNDPNNDYELMIEILCNDEEIGTIKHDNFELKFILFAHNKDLVIPFDWLLKLMNQANKNI